MADLFTARDLGDYLQVPVTDEAAAAVERVVWGWLKPVLGLSGRPTDFSDEVISWALELGAIAHENPAGLESYQLGAERSQFSTERRRQILIEAAGGGGGAATSSPTGSFPVAESFPDPATRWGR